MTYADTGLDELIELDEKATSTTRHAAASLAVIPAGITVRMSVIIPTVIHAPIR